MHEKAVHFPVKQPFINPVDKSYSFWVIGFYDGLSRATLTAKASDWVNPRPVSYTHLTLPTNREV